MCIHGNPKQCFIQCLTPKEGINTYPELNRIIHTLLMWQTSSTVIPDCLPTRSPCTVGRSVSGELAVILWVAITPWRRENVQKSFQSLIANRHPSTPRVKFWINRAEVWLEAHLQPWSLSPEHGPAGPLLWNPHSSYLRGKECHSGRN